MTVIMAPTSTGLPLSPHYLRVVHLLHIYDSIVAKRRLVISLVHG